LEGDPQSARRFLRCQKNCFGNTSEVGVFNMTDAGLQALQNPLMAFISTEEELENAMKLDEDLDGTSITIAMEGSRPIPLEIQALSGKAAIYHDGGMKNSFSRVRGVGVAFDKLQLLFAVLERRARISFQSKSVFVNVAEGYSIQEPAADLAVAIALASAATKRQVVQKTAFLGEIALSGYIRPVKMLESRLSAAHKIGIETCIVPPIRCEEKRKSLKKYHQDLKIVEAVTLFDALQYALPSKS
jgi:DNA repair protein RadA/Sms